MVRSRVHGILAGYADQNDHGTLRTDLVFKVVADHADNDQFVTLSLRPRNVHAALGADKGLACLVTRLRDVWPADAGSPRHPLRPETVSTTPGP
jgi:hypothetical protein